MINRYFFGKPIRKIISRTLIILACSVLMRCGGGTSGSGGVTVDGRIISQSSAPLEGITVTDLASGDSDISDVNGVFGLLVSHSREIEFLFEGRGLNVTTSITDIPSNATHLSVTFRASIEDNAVAPEDVVVEQNSSSTSSSANANNSSSNDSSSSVGSVGAQESSAMSSDDSSGEDHDEMGSSSSEDSKNSDNDNDNASSSSEGAGSSSSTSSNSEEVRREGVIQALSSTLVKVQEVDFTPQDSTEYDDGHGGSLTLTDFVIGERVEARGRISGTRVLLERLKRKN